MFLMLNAPVNIHAANPRTTVGQFALKTLSSLIVGISTATFTISEIDRRLSDHFPQKPDVQNPVATPALSQRKQ